MFKKILLTILLGCMLCNTFAHITVLGNGTASAMPNIATFNINITTTDKTAKAGAALNAEKSLNLIKNLQDIINEPDAITTENYLIQPQYDYTNNKANIIGYTANNIIHVKTQDIANVGNLLDVVSQNGYSQIDNLQFTYNKLEDLYQEALVTATINAKERASKLARANNLVLGEIVSIDTSYNSNEHLFNNKVMATDSMSRVSTPIVAGMVEIKAQIKVIFKLK